MKPGLGSIHHEDFAVKSRERSIVGLQLKMSSKTIDFGRQWGGKRVGHVGGRG